MSLQDIRNLVRKGRLPEARSELRKMSTRNLAREDRLKTAYLAREARFPARVITLLYPIIHPSGRRTPVEATIEEKSEYATALIHSGLTGEAKMLLRDVPLRSHPRAAIALALAHFRHSDFATAARLSAQALGSKPTMRDSERLELKLLHGLAITHGCDDHYGSADLSEARTIFTEILSQIEGGSFGRIRQYALTGIAASHLYEGNWDECDRGLDKIDEFLSKQELDYMTQVQAMWRSFSGLGRAIEQGGSTSRLQKQIAELRAGFVETGYDNFARTCDWEQALLLKDGRALERLYFSASQASVKASIEKTLALWKIPLPDYHDRRLSEGEKRPPRLIDLADLDHLGLLGLKPDQVPTRIFMALATDAYVRPNQAHLFETCFPGEHFNPGSSLKKTEQGITRLRRRLQRSRAPLAVAQKNGRYWLEPTADVVIRILKDGPCDISLESRLFSAFGSRDFTAKEFEREFGVSARTANYRIGEAVRSGALVRRLHGRATRYRLRASKS